METIDTERLAHVFVEVADTLVADFDLIDFLHTVAEHAATVSGAASVGIVLADEEERLHFMAASTQDAWHLEIAQLQGADGPCLECYRTRAPVVITDMSTAARRWPLFTERASSLGIDRVHAFPMRLRDRAVGAMNVFGEQARELDKHDVAVVQALADVATIAILQEQAITAAEALTEQLQMALNSRVVIEQAKGAVARTKGVGVDDAFALLRSHARTNNLRLTDVAHGVVSGSFDFAALGSVELG